MNADGILEANEDVFGYNVFAYVSNNPIVSVDPNGNFASIIGALASLALPILGIIAAAVVVQTAKRS